MEGVPDTSKRVRLDQDRAAYNPPPAPIHSASASGPSVQPQQYSDHPPSAPPALHYRLPPTTLPPQAHTPTQPSLVSIGPPGPRPQHHPPPSPPPGIGAPPYRETLPDPRTISHFQPPISHPGYGSDHRPGYGAVNPAPHTPLPPPPVTLQHHQQPPAPYSAEPTSQPPVVTASPTVPEPQRGVGLPPQPPGPPVQDPSNPPMEHGNHPQPSVQFGVMDPHGIPNGLPYPPPQLQQQDPYAAHHHQQHPGSYPPTPVVGTFPSNGFGGQGPAGFGNLAHKRRQVRAQQACNHCRQRKQKCDEARPCGYCKTEGVECEYREVPPPKTDRTMMQMLDQHRALGDRVGSLEETILRMESNQQQTVDLLQQLVRSQAKADPNLGYAAEAKAEAEAIPAQPAAGNKEDPEVKNVFSVDTAPPQHNTGAHHLIEWKGITKYFQQAGVFSEEYAQREEEKQPLLAPYGYRHFSEDRSGSAPMADAPSPALSGVSPHSDPIGWPSPDDSIFGDSFKPTPNSQQTNVGGLNPDASLRLDRSTVHRLYSSYMRNMWVLHPFLGAAWLEKETDQFIRQYSPTPLTPQSSFVVPPIPPNRAGYGGLPAKRKRPSTEDEHYYDSSGMPYSAPPRHEIRKSPRNAIILLVLALGKLLEHDAWFLQDGKPVPPAVNNFLGSQYMATSPTDFKPSPTQSHASLNHASPGAQSGYASRSSSAERSSERRKFCVRNVDKIPGLAYFASALHILSTIIAGTDIIHAQAFLLAGLYYGQLGKVMESWTWISNASRVTNILRMKNQEYLRMDPTPLDPENQFSLQPDKLDDDATLILMLCWSTLQLESDIRAEFDRLPSSGLQWAENHLKIPATAVGVPLRKLSLPTGEDVDWEEAVLLYSAHIWVRLLLNRTHMALYAHNLNATPVTKAKEDSRLSWADADAGMLWHSLAQWRSMLPIHLQWRDGDKPPNNLQEARLRAKYYGAAYIILRPFLYHALDNMSDATLDPNQWLQKRPREPSPPPVSKDGELQGVKQLPKLSALRKEDLVNSSELADTVLWCCQKCIDFATYSTIAFDGLTDDMKKRPKVTNIHGTATAQFGNVLVLTNAYKSWLRPFVPRDTLISLLRRTIKLHRHLAPLSSLFNIHVSVLEEAFKDVQAEGDSPRGHASSNWQGHHHLTGHSGLGRSARHPSAGSPASAGTPRMYSMDSSSAHSSFSG
ncbi:hypothetical protein EJ06DRAFT_343294 [Trichodelitschia bisporula]|uniref:Zn(2)-C6 fungal-type domain-containing protein n=1 Tax=Trichodelitschia bisporula TaxID=703511 RepID=A0A6G1I2V1_9PEZI|nr:hypothetical protein EJ06DRAFT_343294 [Trichodelitschia bisporula]